jgi:hypothetical protein
MVGHLVIIRQVARLYIHYYSDRRLSLRFLVEVRVE